MKSYMIDEYVIFCVDSLSVEKYIVEKIPLLLLLNEFYSTVYLHSVW